MNPELDITPTLIPRYLQKEVTVVEGILVPLQFRKGSGLIVHALHVLCKNIHN